MMNFYLNQTYKFYFQTFVKFLKVNKDLLGIGLAPIEILIISQVLEF